MLRCRATREGVNPAAGPVFGAVFSSVEVQAPSFHLLAFVIFSLTDSRSHPWVTPQPFRNRRIRRHQLRGLTNMFLRPAGSGPVAHALHIFFCVVAVAIAVAKCGRKITPLLPHPQPLGRDAELACGFRDPVRCVSMLIHAISIKNDTRLRYRYFSGYRYRRQDRTTGEIWR
jgi:hypothetical protein